MKNAARISANVRSARRHSCARQRSHHLVVRARVRRHAGVACRRASPEASGAPRRAPAAASACTRGARRCRTPEAARRSACLRPRRQGVAGIAQPAQRVRAPSASPSPRAAARASGAALARATRARTRGSTVRPARLARAVSAPEKLPDAKSRVPDRGPKQRARAAVLACAAGAARALSVAAVRAGAVVLHAMLPGPARAPTSSNASSSSRQAYAAPRRARVHLPRGPSTSSGAASPEEKEAAACARPRARGARARGPRRGAHGRRDARARVSARRPATAARAAAGSSPRSRSISSLTCADRRPTESLTCATRVGRGVTPGGLPSTRARFDVAWMRRARGSLRSAVSRRIARRERAVLVEAPPVRRGLGEALLRPENDLDKSRSNADL